ncbi:LysR family transcriptional regulator [Kerstersia gyiorum]|uniref:LysR substrate-binding domain-containing protein n=1 Tax=Kerstersia gyiorum TaxID=206506 RepID=UPI001070749B|nr:LysR substrate-binding domain-containing protein [Kerstersia gyiorum]QBR41350.1 LysR family transcriptional regulator [Kerstersia gyiorum]
MRFDLTDLSLFQHICESGTITAGAERSHLTLASASERVRGMEATLGVALLRRDRRGVTPTPAGQTLLHHARLMTQQMALMHGELQQYGQGLKGLVRMSSNGAAFSEYLPTLLGSFLHRYPGISIDIEERASHEVVDALRRGACELGIAADSADLSGLRQLPFRHDTLVLIVPPGHALAARRSIGFDEVAGADFVGLDNDSALQQHIAQHARRQHGGLPAYRIRARSFEAVCRMVGSGAGIAVVPKVTAMRCARHSGIRRLTLEDAWAERTLVLCTRAGEPLSRHAGQLAAHLLGCQDDATLAWSSTA